MVSIRDFQSFDVSSILITCSICGKNWYSIRSHKPDSVGSIPTPATNKIIFMEEVEKVKSQKSPKSNSSKMEILISTTIRDLVRQVNELKIQRDSIITIIKDNSQFFLIYYN